ncbi:MAG: hypothetical protein KAI22_04925 [Gammaproteobacteria bacterium]|nr:hypothetical protein [Gammaproteobacteria bacterium]
MLIMKVRYLFAMLLLLCLTSGAAIAKDEVLKQRMIDLERVYIPALFLTSQDVPPAVPALSLYVASWDSFRDDYRTYRSSWRNWIAYFDHVQDLIDEAVELVAEDDQLEAHEVLELIRTTLQEFRGRNGFPKFVTDELTEFHTIMGEIIAVSQSDFDDDTINILYDLYDEGSHAWFKVEKNTVDADAWGLSQVELNNYNNLVIVERNALDAFAAALSGGDIATISSAASGLKLPQAMAYLLLGDL